MRKQIAVFSILFLISPTLSLEIEQISSYNAKEEIREFKVDQKTVFLTSNNRIEKISPKENWSKHFDSQISPNIDINSKYLVTGTKISSSDLLILERDGSISNRISLDNWIDDVSILSDHKPLFTGSSEDFLEVYSLNGNRMSRFDGGGHARMSEQDATDIDNDNKKEFTITGGSRFRNSPKFELAEVDGDIEWETGIKPGYITGRYLSNHGILLRWSNGVSLRTIEGNTIWNKNSDSDIYDVSRIGDKIVISTSDNLIYRNLNDGSLVKRISISEEISQLSIIPKRELMIGIQGDNITVFDLNGTKKKSVQIKNFNLNYELTNFDSDQEKEIALTTGNKVRFYDIVREREKEISLNHSVSETVFVGKGKEMFKAVALNQTSFITEDYNEVKNQVKSTDLKTVSVNVDGPNQTEDINQAFNITKNRYYAESRDKAVYVAALAARNNASLTFDKSKADMDFSNHSVEELQNKFVEEYKPNHIAVANFESEKGLLAAYMAVKQGSLPVNFDQEYNYPEEDVNAIKWNQDNGVISLNRKINNKFKQIGENQNTIFDGKYVSLLSGPRKMHNDPVDPGLISDPEDGSNYHSDLSYGNLDSDRMLEAGVGRYPTKTSQASIMFHRSMEREIGEDALVASEYLNSNWPVILATFGGGMRHGEVTSQVLEREGFNTTQIVERRSQPVAFLFDLIGVPTQMDIFVKSVDLTQAEIGSLLTQGSARAIKNAAYLIRGLQYGEKAMEMYFEFEWGKWEPSDQELDIPEEINREEFGDLVLSFLPDSKTRLNEEKLVKHMENSDIIYYQGIGNDKKWVLPNNDSSKFISDRYNGTNSLKPKEIPELEKPIVFDSSNMAGTRNAEMKNAFFEKGASAFVGFSGVNYAAFSSHIDQVFFRRGKTLGNSLKRSVNSLRQGTEVFHPSSAHISGVGEKMSRSASLYGNPEMPKDPISSDRWNKTQECNNFECTVKLETRPEHRIKQREDKRLLSFNTTKYILVPGAPITPLYSANYKLPQNANITDTDLETDYKEMENVYLPKTELLSHSGNYTNISEEFKTFPENLSNTTVKENELRHLQAGIQNTSNTTRVLQNIQLQFSYKTPVSMQLSKENDKAVATVNSKKEFDAELIYSLGKNKSSRNVEIIEGENSFEIGELEKGVTEVEVYLVDQKIVEQTETELKVKRDPEFQVFAPDIHRGDVRKVRAIIENTNSFAVTEEFRIETGDNLQLGILEDPVSKVRLDPYSTEQVSWRFTGIQKGNSSIKLRNSSENLTVKSGRSTNHFLGTGRFYQDLGSPYRSFTQEQSDSKLVLELETERGKVRYVEKPGFEYSEIETDQFSAVKNQSAGRKIEKVTTPGGSYIRKVSNGVVKTDSEGISENQADKLVGDLEKEIKKLNEIYID